MSHHSDPNINAASQGTLAKTDTRLPWSFGDSQFSVVCRVRPVLQNEENSEIMIKEEQNSIALQGTRNNMKVFSFHKIFPESVRQSDFTKTLCDQVMANFDRNVRGSLVLSYGVTNSGKTHTILGTLTEPGVLPELISRLETKYPNEVYISAVQAYNDQFFSLKTKEKLYPKQNWGSYEFEDYSPEQITEMNNEELLRLYIKNRSQLQTKGNKKSSRSHAIFKLHCRGVIVGVVDLAGSERLDKVNCSLNETTSINQNLLSLGRCLQAFKSGSMIPFRESKLTKALVQFFGPQFKVYLVAHLNRSASMLFQNYKVLEYAALAKELKPLNSFVNRSIMKSAKKSMKINRVIPEETEQGERIRMSPFGRSLKKSATSTRLETRKREEETRFIDMYKATLIGIDQEYTRGLDRSLGRIEISDEKFIRGLNGRSYVSPVKQIQQREQDIIERVKRELIAEFRRAKQDRAVDYATFIGESIQKNKLENQLAQAMAVSPLKEEEDGFFRKIFNSPLEMIKSSARKFQQTSRFILDLASRSKIKKECTFHSFPIFHGEVYAPLDIEPEKKEIREHRSMEHLGLLHDISGINCQTERESHGIYPSLSLSSNNSMLIEQTFDPAYFNPTVIQEDPQDQASQIIEEQPRLQSERKREELDREKERGKLVRMEQRIEKQNESEANTNADSNVDSKGSVAGRSRRQRKAHHSPMKFMVSPIKTRAGRSKAGKH